MTPAASLPPDACLWAEIRHIARHAWPILVAQLASMGLMLIDTALLGHYGAADLAAVAIGGGIYIAVIMACAGVLQAVAPVVAHLHGAGRHGEIAAALQQAFCIALVLAVPACLLMRFPDPLLAMATMEPAVEAKTRAYLGLLAWGLPLVLLYRTFFAFANALGHSRPLMLISLVTTALHLPLSWGLIHGYWGGPPLGVEGTGLSTLAIVGVGFGAGLFYLCRSPALKPLALLSRMHPPSRERLREQLRLGLPMGFSNLVEISAFTLIALFIARQGAEVVAGHRIVANLAALLYMLPLAVAIATLARVGRAAGAQDRPGMGRAVRAGMALAGGLSLFFGVLLWLVAEPLVTAYTGDGRVAAVALGLVGYLAAYQLFDAIQTIAGFSLRGCKVTFLPMLIHTLSFWGVGLGGGWWLAYGTPAMGVSGYWAASTASLVLAAVLLGGLLWRVLAAARE
ncbi:MAG TPA: MATE family efflux transporter [Azospira sp.]|nr:MATE family efflux transporter [Azospira sp.]